MESTAVGGGGKGGSFRVTLLSALAGLWVACALTVGGAQAPEGLRIVVLDVGQGDAAVVLAPDGEAMVIDGGRNDESGEAVVEALRGAGREGIEALVVSHYDSDHIGGADKVLTELGLENVGVVLDPGPEAHVKPGRNHYGGYVRAAGDEENTGEAGKRRTIRSGEILRMGELCARCVVVNGDVDDGMTGSANDVPLELAKREDSNARSVGLLLTLGEFEYLTCGDLTSGERGEAAVEEALIAARALYNTSTTTPERRWEDEGRVDVYHVDHHGSDTSSGPSFVRAIGPRVAVVSCGGTEYPNSGYRHPRPDVLALLDRVGARTYATGEGNVSAADYSLGAALWRLPVSVALGGRDILVEISADGKRYRVWPQRGMPSEELSAE